MKKNILAFLNFALDTLLATIGFVLILGAAYGLHHIVEWASGVGFPDFVIFILKGLEYAIFIVDAILLMWLVVNAAFKCAKEING